MQTQTVFLFGKLAEFAGQRTVELPTASTVGELRAAFKALHPILKDEAFSIAVNQQLQSDEYPLTEVSEIAFLPAFSGG